MKGWLKWSLVTLIVGAVAFALTPFWPISPTAPQPPGTVLPLFIALSLVESLSLGLGVAFLIFGRPLVSRLGGSPVSRRPLTSQLRSFSSTGGRTTTCIA